METGYGEKSAHNVQQKQKLSWPSAPLLLKLSFACFVLGQAIIHGPSLARSLSAAVSLDAISYKSGLASSTAEAFEWGQMQASDKLAWKPCVKREGIEYECARLLVPLDHFNGTTEKQISLALIRVPAKVPPTDARYGGAILYNPGGPGGSGVDFLQRNYQHLSNVIEPVQASVRQKFFDHISFDPRGVGLSTPRIGCFSSDLLSFTWDLRIMQEGVLGSSNAAFGRLWSMSSALSGSCSLSAARDGEDIKRFVSTAAVAADMVTIIERHGEWREAEAIRLLSQHGSHRVAIPAHWAWQKGEEKLNYWGFSYGTYLGMTFASMYPNRVNRLVIDGVVDTYDYVKTLWADNLADTEKEMQSFHRYCAEAGYPACALANEKGNTTSDEVEARVRNITDSLIHNPLPVLEPYAEVVTYSDIKNTIFAALYTPIKSFPLVANALRDVERGNGTIFAALLQPYHQPPVHTLDGPQPIYNSTTRLFSPDATIAIGCGDGDSQSFVTRELFREHYHNLTAISPTIGPMWALCRGRCVHWTVRPLYRFTGPWTAKTSFPMLFIGNSADPVTPVRNARKLVTGYQEARLIEQGSSGHCSLAAKSNCTETLVRNYFQHGELPEDKDTFCNADEVPFGGATVSTHGFQTLLSERVWSGPSNPLMPMV